MLLVVFPDLDISRPPFIIEAQPAMVPTAMALTKMLHRFKKRALHKHCIMNKPLLNSQRDQANFKNYDVWKNTIVNRYKDLKLKNKKNKKRPLSYITNLSNALNSESMLLKYLSWDFIWAREETPPPEAHITYYCWQSDLRGKNEVWAESSGDFFIPWGPLNLTENYFFVTKWRRGGGDLKWFKKKKKKCILYLHSRN